MAHENHEALRVAILATDGFEQAELEQPKKALEDAGFDVEVITPSGSSIRGWNKTDWGSKVSADLALEDSRPEDFDALVLPGGVMNPDTLRQNPAAVDFVRAFFNSGKPVSAICHGPWTLVEADVVRGKRMTSWPSLKTDLRNAGANWVDEEVVVHDNLITSRKPADIPAFNREIIKMLSSQHVGVR